MSLRAFTNAAAFALILTTAPTASAVDLDIAWADDMESDAYGAMTDDNETSPADVYFDDNVRPAQAASQQGSNRGFSTRTASRGARATRTPYMIGDSPSTYSGGVAVSGVPFSDVGHPIFGQNRINVSENGIVVPNDRVFVTYRHFHDAEKSNVLGFPGSTDLEQFTVGFEKTAFDGMFSAGLRVPLLRQLNSDLDIYDIGDGVSNLPVSDRSGELGNLGVTFKLALIERDQAGLTAGLAVNCPTGEDARILQDLYGPGLPIVQAPGVTTIPDTNLLFDGQFDNDTVNLIPFAAWYLRPSARLFHHGFLQIDAPLNRSDATISAEGEITASSTFNAATFNVTETGELDQQTLLRLNMGLGYWLTRNTGNFVDSIAAVVECHYTGTLDNANPFVVPLTVLDSSNVSIADVPVDIVAGPTNNDINQVNLSTGLVANVAMFQITNGVIVPVSNDEDRSFNFEYSLQINRWF
jgi:hypothetical protein